MPTVKYRSVHPNLRPRRTKLEVPGWAGASEPRADGSHEQPWHCIPFSEAVRAGLEVCFPYDHELRITMEDGALRFDEFLAAAIDESAEPLPFRPFGKDFYTYQSLIDLRVEETHAIKVETHPRFYTDATGTVPIAVPALLRPWWPMIYFVVFKSPAEGQTHIFRPGEPFMQVTAVEADATLDVQEMAEDEAAERELMARRIYASRATLGADTRWTSSTNTVFDGTYRRLAGAAKSTLR